MTTSECESQKRLDDEILAELMRELDALDLSQAAPNAYFSFEPQKTAELLRRDQLKKMAESYKNDQLRTLAVKPRNPLGSQAEIARYRREEGREDYNDYQRRYYAAMIKITEGRDVREYRDLSGLTPEQKAADRRKRNTAARSKKRAADKAANEAQK